MKYLLLAAFTAVAIVAAPMLGVAQDRGKTGEPADANPLVATVNGHEIRDSDIAAAYERLPAQYKQIPMNALRPQLIQQVVSNYLMETAGRALGLQNDEKVKAQLRAFEAAAIQQAYLERKIAEFVTEEEILRVYETTIGNAEGPEEVRASHILVETEEEGRKILEELTAGADFAALAQKHSTGPSGPRGGDLGYFTRDRMVEPFAKAAFALDVGAISPDPVHTQFGWHVIKVVDKRRQPAPGLEEARARIEDLLTREFITAHMAELRANAEIELVEQGGTPSGGAAKP